MGEMLSVTASILCPERKHLELQMLVPSEANVDRAGQTCLHLIRGSHHKDKPPMGFNPHSCIRGMAITPQIGGGLDRRYRVDCLSAGISCLANESADDRDDSAHAYCTSKVAHDGSNKATHRLRRYLPVAEARVFLCHIATGCGYTCKRRYKIMARGITYWHLYPAI